MRCSHSFTGHEGRQICPHRSHGRHALSIHSPFAAAVLADQWDAQGSRWLAAALRLRRDELEATAGISMAFMHLLLRYWAVRCSTPNQPRRKLWLLLRGIAQTIGFSMPLSDTVPTRLVVQLGGAFNQFPNLRELCRGDAAPIWHIQSCAAQKRGHCLSVLLCD